MSRKDDNAVKAREWVEKIERNGTWSGEIKRAAERSIILKGELITQGDLDYVAHAASNGEFKVEVTDETTHEAICRLYYEGYIVGALNFASYYKPGGGFLRGSMAQEESLCAVSGLYPVLSMLRVYRDRRSRKDVPDEYDNELIYSPMVPFTDGEGKLSRIIGVDIMSCAAPNCNRIPASKVHKIQQAITDRLTACYALPYTHGVSALILGAWGCGVFKNDPEYIANCFKGLNEKYGACYGKVVYALPNDKMREQFEGILLN